MTESAPLLDNFDENAPRIGEAHTKKMPASAYFRPLFKILAITTVVISVVNLVLLIATCIISRRVPPGNFYSMPWDAQKTAKVLAILVCALRIFLSASLAFNYKNIDVRSPCHLWHQYSLHSSHLSQCRRRHCVIGMYYPTSRQFNSRDAKFPVVSTVYIPSTTIPSPPSPELPALEVDSDNCNGD